MYEEPPLLSVEACHGLERLIAKAAHEALELVVVYDAKGEDGCSHTGPKSVPDAVTLFADRGGPALDMQMHYQQLVPNAPVLIHLEPKVVGGVQAMPCD